MIAVQDNLDRFISAQEPVYKDVVAELTAGKKRSHWMWFIFPQFAGLGLSETSIYFSLKSIEETQAYLHHTILGSRLRECTHIVNMSKVTSVDQIFGFPDNLKFYSCMTLFEIVAEPNSIFSRAIEKYFSNIRDVQTISLLENGKGMR